MTNIGDVPLTTPEGFNAFPYNPPYSIQDDLMRHLYSSIENRKLAIVESPTGTGKTLSLLTSSLTWLHDDRDRTNRTTLESLRGSLNSDDNPEWVTEQTLERLKTDLEAEDQAFEGRLAELRSREQALRKGCARVTKRPRLSTTDSSHKTSDSDDDSYLPDTEGSVGIQEETKADPFSHHDELRQEAPLAPTSTRRKIFFASRTHSQLSQVIHELRKLNPIHATLADTKSPRDDLRTVNSESSAYVPRSVSLASRRHLCINEQLRKKTVDLDEGCRELLTGRPENRCPYLPVLGDEYRLHDLRDRILASPKDIEDLVLAGREAKVCPYFGCRSAVPSAEVRTYFLVTLPYNLLLYKRSRQALGIDIKDQVLIIDEAHNLIETLLQLHTIEMPTRTLRRALGQLTEYLTRFRTRLTASHANHLKRLILFLQALVQFVQGITIQEEVMSVSKFVDGMGSKVNGINFLDLQSYLATSKLARKVSKYSERKGDSSEASVERDSSAPLFPLHLIEAFISSLSNDVEDGIITITADKTTDEKHIKYQHLNPATYFDDLVRDARCVILAGGTMSPVSDLRLQLLPTLEDDRLSTFSCGHIIPQSNLLCLVVGKGPRGKDLEFKYKSRDDESLIDELGQCLSNFCSLAPNGVVVFLPSYAFLDRIKRSWSSSGMLDRINKKKQIFYEPLEGAAVDNILRDYAIACAQTAGTAKGAMLFAVVGGKLSEGLNFADELARAVVLVGIPYPNLFSSELRERMKYLNSRAKQSNDLNGRDPGSELYENLAMRAVNQSIGRAVRHQNDWSALLLIDSRYGSQKVQVKLPTWIRQNIKVTQTFGQAVKYLGEFYRSKRP